jgi:hypothetical protein
MRIFIIQANQAICAATAQRVLREQALAQRVAEEQQGSGDCTNQPPT